jgi:hypothetical protein
MANEETFRAAEARDGSVEPIMPTANGTTTTNKSAPASSSGQQSPDNHDVWARIRPHLTSVPERIKPHIDFVPKLLFALWNVSLLLGGLIFITYFASIGFMPEIGTTASVTLLSVSALTGAGLLIAMDLSLIAHSYVWIQWTISYEPLKSLWSDKEGKFSHWRAKLWFGLPLIGFLGGVFSLFLVEKEWHTYVFWGGFLISSIVALIVAFVFLRNQSQKWQALGLLGISVLVSALTISPMILILNIVIGTAPNLRIDTIGTTPQVIIFISAVGFILAFNAALVGSRGRRRPSILEYIAFTAVSTFFLLIMLQATTYIPKRVMNLYQFGYIPASLVLTDVGCMILDSHNIPASLHKNTCRVSDVTIYSRLGSTYYVQVNGSDNTPVCLTIPSQHVLSWAISKPKKETVWPPKPCI